MTSAGPEAIEIARLAGLDLDLWQEAALTDMLGERAGGKWASFEVGLNVGRQNGKGTIEEVRELTGAFHLGEQLIIHSAHEQLTSSAHFRRMLNLMEGVPEFERRILKAPKGKGSEAIELRGGQMILFKTRTGGGGRGLTGDLVVLDEAMILPAAVTGVLIPLLAARSMMGNPQVVYAGSQVDRLRHEHGIVFARVRARALAGVPRLMYLEWSAGVEDWLLAHGLPFDPERSEIDQITSEMLDDREMWAQANPGLGIRISVEFVENERGGALSRREFAVERLGITDPPDTSEDPGRVIGSDAWRGCAEHDRSNRIVGTPSFAVDVDPDQTWASVAVGGKRADGLLQGAVVAHDRGTDWIVSFCVRLKKAHHGAKFTVHTRSTGSALIEAMQAARLRLIEASTEDYGRACMGFFADVVAGRFRYPASHSLRHDLDDALANARKDPLGDAWKWSRRNSTSADISPLVAVTLAHWASETGKPRARVINPNV